jgi:hypothetical protein
MTKRKAPALALPPPPDGLTFATFGPWQEDAFDTSGNNLPDIGDAWHVAVVVGLFHAIAMNDDEAHRHIAARRWLASVPGWGLHDWGQTHSTQYVEMLTATLVYGLPSIDPDEWFPGDAKRAGSTRPA